MALHRQGEARNFTEKPAGFLRRAWPLIKKLLPVVFFALVLWLLVSHAREIDWQGVKEALSDYSWSTIIIGGCLALATYCAYSSYDLFGRYYVRHGVSVPRTMLIAFISCAFTLNLGALIGSIGFRYRMYSEYGVSGGDTTRVIGMSLTTNWLGYILLAGLVFVTGSVVVPFDWAIDAFALKLIGVAFIAVVLAYFALCQFARKRSWNIRGHEITLPSTRIAVGQLVISSAHWLLMCGIIFSFLSTEIGYFALLGVLLLSAIAGLIAHIPGALGVLETVFIALLGHKVEPAILVAALIAYRVVFYLWPLSIAVVAYLILDIAGRRNRQKS